MSKNLVIVESPAKAKTISKILGKNYKVMASVGHVRDLPKSKMGIDIDNNFEPQYITIRGKGDVIKELKSARKKADTVYLATDPDREGEAIAWHLAAILGLDETQAFRIEFHEITKDAVKGALKSPKVLNHTLVDAQQARRVLDRLVGYSISPMLWRKIRKGLSAGRVQSAATKIICDREREIKAFIPEEYWSIHPSFKNGAGHTFEAQYYGSGGKSVELPNESAVKAVLKAVKDKPFTVIKIAKKQKNRGSYPCFTTSSLQQEAANRYGFTTKKTMMIAQQLYEGITVQDGTVGLITYMRTDSVRISEEARKTLREFIEESFSKEYLSESNRKRPVSKSSQDAHEAIRPTSVHRTPESVAPYLNQDQAKLYRLIWERFVASEMADSVSDSVQATIGCNGHEFRANGSKLRFEGFLKVYSYASVTENELPQLEEAEELKLLKMNHEQHFTQPPARYSEATLVKEMEELGIGRPSTYAPTISTILARGYVVKEKKNLLPTELGELINEIMEEYFDRIVDVRFTAEMENQLDMVSTGEMQWREVIDTFYQPFALELKRADEAIEKIDLSEMTDIPCDKCGAPMMIKHGRFGKFMACSKYPECSNTKPILNRIDIKCPVCHNGDVVERKTKKFKNFYGCSEFPACNFVSWHKPIGRDCPECGSFLVEKITKKKAQITCSSKTCSYHEEIEQSGNETDK